MGDDFTDPVLSRVGIIIKQVLTRMVEVPAAFAHLHRSGDLIGLADLELVASAAEVFIEYFPAFYCRCHLMGISCRVSCDKGVMA